jgi:hypothetical protein
MRDVMIALSIICSYTANMSHALVHTHIHIRNTDCYHNSGAQRTKQVSSNSSKEPPSPTVAQRSDTATAETDESDTAATDAATAATAAAVAAFQSMSSSFLSTNSDEGAAANSHSSSCSPERYSSDRFTSGTGNRRSSSSSIGDSSGSSSGVAGRGTSVRNVRRYEPMEQQGVLRTNCIDCVVSHSFMRRLCNVYVTSHLQFIVAKPIDDEVLQACLQPIIACCDAYISGETALL